MASSRPEQRLVSRGMPISHEIILPAALDFQLKEGITGRPKDRALTRELVEGWYSERARIKFRERLVLCQQRFPKPKDDDPAGLVVRQLQQRWGSMTAEGKLILNRSLIRSSVDAIV